MKPRRPQTPRIKLGGFEHPLYNVGKVVATPEKDGSLLDKEMGVQSAETPATLQNRERPKPQDTPTHIIFKQDVTLPEYPDTAPMVGYTKITDVIKAEREKQRVPRRKLGENMTRSTTYQLVMRVLEEGRGRRRKDPNDPKWQKKPANGEEGDEMEGLGQDSGREADQHIHRLLGAAADSEKGADIKFEDGKTKRVSQEVAKPVHAALSRLKTNVREKIHNHIVKSHANLMDFHSALQNPKKMQEFANKLDS